MTDYSVTWNEVKEIIDFIIPDSNERMPIAVIEEAMRQAWDVLFYQRYQSGKGDVIVP